MILFNTYVIYNNIKYGFKITIHLCDVKYHGLFFLTTIIVTKNNCALDSQSRTGYYNGPIDSHFDRIRLDGARGLGYGRPNNR